MNSQSGASVLRFIRLAAVTLIFVSCVQSAQSSVYVYDSFGPGHDFVSYAYWGVDGASGSGGYVGHAESFVPTLSGNLDTVQVACVQLSSGTGLANFHVAADNGGTPGAMLESFMNVVAPASSSSFFLVTMNSITQPLLHAGTTYWLYAEPAENTTAMGWFVNDQGYRNDYAQESPPGEWTSASVTFGANGVFAVSVTPVPEPSMLTLLAVGAMASLARRRQSRR
jgi:PEP-CTERM motif